MWQWRHNSLSSKSNYCLYQHFLWKCFLLRILGVLVICCVKFHKNLFEEFRQFETSLNSYKKVINYAWTEAGLNADKFATFWRFPKNFYHSFILQMMFIHSTTGWAQVDLHDFLKTWKHVNQSNAMLSSFCNFKGWKQQFDQNSSVAIDQCAIKSLYFVSIENFLNCLM